MPSVVAILIYDKIAPNWGKMDPFEVKNLFLVSIFIVNLNTTIIVERNAPACLSRNCRCQSQSKHSCHCDNYEVEDKSPKHERIQAVFLFQVDFGCVLNDTEHIRNVTVTNQSPLKVKFKWNFEENAINFDGKEDDEGLL